jgi:Luciferase-like monooxygenase
MSDRPFRFAVQATPQDGPQWLATARRAEELGYATLMMPDGMQLLSPLPALALAAGATTSLRVGTFVLASALRPPGLAAWDAHSLSVLSGDIVTLAIGPLTSRDEAARLAAEVRETAGPRAGLIEFESPIFVVGDEAPPWVRRFLQADLATLVERDSLLILRGSPRQMADELLRRREEIGVSYVSVNSAFCEQFAPVVELLAGG